MSVIGLPHDGYVYFTDVTIAIVLPLLLYGAIFANALTLLQNDAWSFHMYLPNSSQVIISNIAQTIDLGGGLKAC